MDHWRSVRGEVRHVGNVKMRGGQEDCCLLDSLVIRESDGQTVRWVDVVVPSAIQDLLKLGDVAEFDVLVLNYPKPFGSTPRTFVVRLKSADGCIDGIQNVVAWIRGSKGAAFHFLWCGGVLMPAFGFGLLLWLCALRLLILNVPSDVVVASPRG